MQIDVPELTLPGAARDRSENVVLPGRHADRSRNPPGLRWRRRSCSQRSLAFACSASASRMTRSSEEVLAHLDHEPAALRLSSTPVSDDAACEALCRQTVAQLDHSAGLITYARSCSINGKTVPHLVIQGEHGPITILLMPEEAVAAAVALDGENVHGVILPVGDGSIAIIGAREEKLERIEKSVVGFSDVEHLRLPSLNIDRPVLGNISW